MTAETPALVRTFTVGKRFTVTVTMQRPERGKVVNTTMEWEPDVPAPGSLTDGEIADYRAGRNAAVAELAEAAGLNVAVVEV